MLSINHTDPARVYRTEESDTEFLVAENITVGKPMYLDKGYVPSDEWAASANDWEEEPLPVGHPIDANGNVLSAHDDDVADQTVVGEFRNSTFDEDDEELTGDLWIDVDEANSKGGYYARVVEILEEGDSLEVSTAYNSEESEPGEYDGSYRHSVRKNLDPDHIALLPDDLGPGRCSRIHGCGVPAGTADDALAANASAPTGGVVVDVSSGTPPANLAINMAAPTDPTEEPTPPDSTNILAEARVPTYTGTVDEGDPDDDEWLYWSLNDYLEAYVEETGEQFEGDPYSALSTIPEGAYEWIAEHTLLGDPEAVTEENLMLFDVVGPDGRLYERRLKEILGMDGSRATIPEEQRESAREVAADLLDEEFSYNPPSGSANADPSPGRIQRAIERGVSAAMAPFMPEGEASANDCGCGEHAGDDGCQCDPAEADEPHPDETDDKPMQNIDYDELAANSAFDAEELRENDELAEKVNETVSANSTETDDGGDADAGTETTDSTETTETTDGPDGGESTEDGTEEGDRYEELVARVDSLESDLGEKEETIQTLKADRDEAIESEEEQLRDEIQANSNQYPEEVLDEMSLNSLRAAHAKVTEVSANSAGASGTDFGAIRHSPAQPHQNVESSNSEGDDEETETPGTSHGGSYADYRDSQEADD